MSIPRVKVTLPGGSVKVWLTGDLQYGAATCDKAKFERHLARARKERWRVILIGDMTETLVASSRIAAMSLHEQETEAGVPALNGQMEAVAGFFRGLPVDGYVSGNHEARALASGFDPARALSRELGAAYLKDGGFVTYRFNGSGRTVSIFAHHGEGSGATYFDKLERDFPGASVYCGGHTHELSVTNVIKHTPTITYPVHRIRTGSYLKTPQYVVRKPGPALKETGSVLLELGSGGIVVSLLV